MLRLTDRVLHGLAVCHLLIAAALLLCALRQWTVAGLLCCAVGFGGLGAAWGRDTDDGHDWLSVDGALHRPSRSVVSCAVEHAPFVLVGAALLIWQVG